MFINRKKELHTLQSVITKNKSSLINMYGPRRIGKTAILKELVNKIDMKALYYVFFEGQSSFQLEQFFETLKSVFPDNTAIQSLQPSSWKKMIEFLLTLQEPMLFVFDEFPYLVNTEKSITSILQNTWDQFHETSKIHLILCGSSISIMKDLMGSRQPLYGRFTNIIPVEALNFADSRLFHSNTSFQNQVYSYLVFGGIPYYHEKIKDFVSVNELLTQVFDILTPFRNEILINLGMTTSQTTNYFSILYNISQGKHTYSKIEQSTKITSNLTHYINTLIEMGLIERKSIFSTSTSSKSSFYVIKDNFTSFWFQFFYSKERELTLLEPSEFITQIVLPQLDKFLSLSFETFCRDIVSISSLNGYFKHKFVKIFNYAGMLQDTQTKEKKDYELDLVGESIDKKALLIGECKWINKVDEWDIKQFMENYSYFKLQYSNYLNKFQKIYLLFISKKAFTKGLQDKYSEIDFIDLERLEKIIINKN